MTDETDIDEQRSQKGRESGGASIRIHDRRFSKLIGWGMTALGAAAVSGIWLAANNLYELNVTVARLADNNVVVAGQLSDHELRLRQMERDVSTLEGKVYRGVDGYKEPVVPRGH